MIRPILHTVLHFMVPALAARFFYKDNYGKVWLIMICTMAIDLDHLLAVPVFDPNRCSIAFHPLHSYPALCAYVLMTFVSELRIIGIGLLIHIGLDSADCLFIVS